MKYNIYCVLFYISQKLHTSIKSLHRISKLSELWIWNSTVLNVVPSYWSISKFVYTMYDHPTHHVRHIVWNIRALNILINIIIISEKDNI